MDFSLVIPMHDEREALKTLLPALESFYARLAPRRTFEVVLMDDGSTDHTFDICWAWAERQHFPAKVVRLNPREGIGGALRSAFPFCGAEAVVTYDADMAYPLDDVERLLAPLANGADIVTASPYHPEGAVEGVDGWRLSISKLANSIYRWRLGPPARHLTALTCGFRAYRRPLLEHIAPRHTGFLATAELLVNGLRRGSKVEEIPSILRPRTAGKSKMKVIRTTLSHLAYLIRCR